MSSAIPTSTSTSQLKPHDHIHAAAAVQQWLQCGDMLDVCANGSNEVGIGANGRFHSASLNLSSNVDIYI